MWSVRWYVAYSIPDRQLQEMMEVRGVAADHATLNRWVNKYIPELENQFRRGPGDASGGRPQGSRDSKDDPGETPDVEVDS